MKRNPLFVLLIGTTLLYLGTARSVVAQSQKSVVEIEGWDTSELDAKIEVLVATARLNPAGTSTEEKSAIAAAYLRRANVFYAAGQPKLYKLALGDFRRALRYQPENAEAQNKRDQITSIYESLGRTVPENGNETDIDTDLRIRYQYKPVNVVMTEGKSSAVFSETLPAGVSFLYALGARAGQRIDVSLVVRTGAASLVMTGGSGPPSPPLRVEKSWHVVALGSEPYIVRVLPGNDGASYNLEVHIR
jgi:hypothetical protein